MKSLERHLDIEIDKLTNSIEDRITSVAFNTKYVINMGIVREPEGVDFIINSTPPTAEERKMISEFIRINKEKYGEVSWEDITTNKISLISQLSSKPLPQIKATA